MPLVTTAVDVMGLDKIPGHGRTGVFRGLTRTPFPRLPDPGFEVDAWLSMVKRDWGACGAIRQESAAFLGEQAGECVGTGRVVVFVQQV